MFRNRTEAGERLAERIREESVEADLVLAIPRGGLPIGRAVADELGVPLDVVVARKIGAPGYPELGIGAVTSDGTLWLNDDLIADLGVGDSYVDRVRDEEAAVAREKFDRYRGGRPAYDVSGKRVIVVDDGVATGGTMFACLKWVTEAGAERVIVAVPVSAPDTYEELTAEADDVVCVDVPQYFTAVGAFYRDFGQVSDTEAISYLDAVEE
ncbi:phosphoribosyltransferase [Halobium salinum]|uniref:Phosphoribosyltransferase n=1 Tax=Halobium salinum TaxID=1364940 RepID=A0ABD5PIS1_9EURY|nr:phosphoribosyltransferase family protein [Halobium salinum]